MHKPFIDYFKTLTSSQKDEQLYLMDKAYEEFFWSRKLNMGSIAMNSTYKFSYESWYQWLNRIKKRI